MVAAGAFLEWAEVYEHRYGSPRAPIMAALERGESILFDIDHQGAMKIQAEAPDDAVTVYILHARSQDSEETIGQRIARAKSEVVLSDRFDYVILNDDFDRAYSDLAHIFHAERLRRARNPWVKTVVQALLDEPI